MLAAPELQYMSQNAFNFQCQVCHHEDCQEANRGHPLLLCLRCDEVHHLGSGSNHARFDVPGKVLDGYKISASELNIVRKQEKAKLAITYFIKYIKYFIKQINYSVMSVLKEIG